MGRPHNILHGSNESAIPKNPLVGSNICSLSATQAELWDFVQILGSKFWAEQKPMKNVGTEFCVGA